MRIIGPRILFAVDPDHGRPRGCKPTSLKAAVDWIIETNESGCNTYFHVNRCSPDFSGPKAAKRNVKWATHSHAELDPPNDCSCIASWRDGLRAKILSRKRPPTLLWSSGNGLQCLWELHPVIDVQDPDDRDAVEARNRYWLRTYGGKDAETQGTFDVSRVLRIPGTINWPDKTKRAKGRVPVLAGDVHHTGNLYRLEELPAVEIAAASEAVVVIGPAEDIEPDELAALELPERLLEIIHYGRALGSVKSDDDSRSAWTWTAICGLLRHKVRPEIIAGIITNPEFEISARYLDAAEKGRDMDQFVREEIARAHARVRADVVNAFPDLRPSRSLDDIVKEAFNAQED